MLTDTFADAHFAAPRFHVKQTHDVDVHAGNLSQWQQCYEQTSPGVFRGEVRELLAGGFQVFEEVANCATAQQCRPWAGGIWFGMAVPDTDAGLRFMGRACPPMLLMMASGEAPFELQVPARHGLYGMVLPREQLRRHVRQLHHIDLPEDWDRFPQAQALSALQRLRLGGMLREVLRSLQASPEVLAHAASMKALREALMTVLADTLLARHRDCQRPSPQQQRRCELVRRVRALALENAVEPMGVADLCMRLHMTRRTLQNQFQEALGMSPAAYLRTLRLNAVRRALRQEAAGGSTIAQTAARWGFWHMGHFCAEYKALFGETPSQT
ncbi:MAG: helix-turn-helix domain protein, partial [Polaromonas sp.]|nr:helix-turn-helix domain protein [Polaromonas sp.]